MLIITLFGQQYSILAVDDMILYFVVFCERHADRYSFLLHERKQ